MLDKTVTFLLAGGVGSRLHPLTADRAKPAVPFGGQYRIIDFTLTNCLHSGLRRVLVLPQYKSHSLLKHLRDVWSVFNPSLGEYITPVPPQQRTDESWYVGTANALYQNLYLLDRSGADHVLVLSGDHVYRMDYAELLRFHSAKRAAATIACMDVPLSDASSFGVMTADEGARITAFSEKPVVPEPIPGQPDRALASMGIYVFSRRLLERALLEDHADESSSHDFGKNILPKLIRRGDLYAYRFGEPRGRVTADAYWRDVGTLDSYYEANMDLLRPDPPIDLYQSDWQIRTADAQSPPARTIRGSSGEEPRLVNSMLAPGAVVRGGDVENSILAREVVVDKRAVVKNSVVFDGAKVGAGARLDRCIVEKEIEIPPGTVIGDDPEDDAARFSVSAGGVVVVTRQARFVRPPKIYEGHRAAVD